MFLKLFVLPVLTYISVSLILGILYSIMMIMTPRPIPKWSENNFHYDKDEIDFISIERATEYVLRKENINNRQELDKWCNGTKRDNFYEKVRKFCKISWLMEDDPSIIVRRAYESMLPGYANSRI
jgi:hypothetical protein